MSECLPEASRNEGVPHPRRWVGVIVLVALALRVPFLSQSIWFDEACMSDQRIGTWSQLLATLYVDIHPPLYLIFMHFWNGVFGDSEWSMRFPPLVCGLLTLPLTFAIGRRFVGDRAALMATAMLALSPVHLWYSVEARLYAPMVLAALLMIDLFHRILEAPQRRVLWGMHALALIAAVGLHYYLAVHVLLLGFLAALYARKPGAHKSCRGLVLLHATVLACLGLFVVAKLSVSQLETSQGYLRALTLPELYRFVFHWCWTGNCLSAGLRGDWGLRGGAWILFQGIGVLLFAMGVRELWRDRWSLGFVSTYLLAIPGFLMVIPWLGLGNTYIERSALPSLPFVFLIASAGLLSIPQSRLRSVATSLVVVLIVSSLAAYKVFDDEWTVYKQHQDWRSVARYFGDELDSASGPRPVFTSFPNARSLAYYDARIQTVSNLEASDEKSRRSVESIEYRLGASIAGCAKAILTELDARKRRLLAGALFRIYTTGDGTQASLKLGERNTDGVIYLLQNHAHPSSGDGTVESLLASPGLEEIERRDFRGVTVHKVRAL